MRRTRIDYSAIMYRYNLDYQTSYSSFFTFFSGLYREHKTCAAIADILTVSTNAVWLMMKDLGVELNPAGHNKVSHKLGVLLMVRTDDLTLEQIAKRADLSQSYCRAVLNKYHKSYKRKKETHNYSRISGNNMSDWELKIQGFYRDKQKYEDYIKKGGNTT